MVSYKWLAILDTDEFLLPLEKDNLIDVLNECSDVALYCYWRCFGDSGIYKINGLMIEELTSCNLQFHYMNVWAKTIFRPEYALNYTNPHYPTLIPGSSIFHAHDKIRINHYWSRDRLFFNETKLSREASFNVNCETCLQRLADYNMDKNTEILRFAPLLKKQMSEFKKKHFDIGHPKRNRRQNIVPRDP